MFGRFLADLMDSPELIRNVTLCGHLHHGKVRVCWQLVCAQFPFELHVSSLCSSVALIQGWHVFLGWKHCLTRVDNTATLKAPFRLTVLMYYFFLLLRRVLWTAWLNKRILKSGREMTWMWVAISPFLPFNTPLNLTTKLTRLLTFPAPIHRHPFHRTGGKFLNNGISMHF